MLYRQSIIIFGIAVPALIAAAVVGAGVFVKSKMKTSFGEKATLFHNHEKDRIAALEIEAKVAQDRHHLDRWTEQLSQEAASTVATTLREIIEKLPSKEIQQTSFERPGSSGGLGGASAQTSSQIRISFRGTYRTLQRAFLELETRLPQLQLLEIRMDPVANQNSLINCQVTYTAWEL